MIICAALRLLSRDFCFGEEPLETILPCHRHSDGYHILRDFGKDYREYYVTQGFITSSGEFLDRKKAYKEALRCGQICAQARYEKVKKGEDELYSEDLY